MRHSFPQVSAALPVRITVGKWRSPETCTMQVVSGYFGHEKIHFEAPVAKRLDKEMTTFLKWFNAPLELDPSPESRSRLPVVHNGSSL